MPAAPTPMASPVDNRVGLAFSAGSPIRTPREVAFQEGDCTSSQTPGGGADPGETNARPMQDPKDASSTLPLGLAGLMVAGLADDWGEPGDAAVFVGADRIAKNGDTANKIGTYSLAVLAKSHGIPFYVAAPMSTFDFSLKTGASIPIEERSECEVTHFKGARSAPQGMKVYNPAFDITPGKLISAIITEKGVLTRPYSSAIACLHEGTT